MKKIIFTAFTFGLTFNSIAQTVALDPSFNTNGKVTTAIGNADDDILSVAVQSDGKIVVSGDTDNGSNTDIGVVRYNSDGSLDNSFGNNGKVTTDFGNGDDSGQSIAIQADGKIVVAGYVTISGDGDFGVVRYKTNGTLDSTFGTFGKVHTDFGSIYDSGNSLIIQSDGKIVVSGSHFNGSNSDYALARYNNDGSLDATFGTAGKVTMTMGTGDDEALSLKIQSDGKIVAAGLSYDNSGANYSLARYNSNGSLDNTFAFGGKLITTIGTSHDYGVSLAIQNDGKLVIASTSGSSSADGIFTVIRYNQSDGSLDNTFGTNGKVTTDFGGLNDLCKSIVIQSDGKILVTGGIENGSNLEFVLVRYNTNGSLDNTFGVGGKLTTAIGASNSAAETIAIQTDGKIIIAGGSSNGSNYDFAVARYTNTSTGIENIVNSTEQWAVYPNPTDGKFNLVNNQKEQTLQEVSVYNVLGEKIYSNNTFQKQSSNEIDISSYPKGVYFVSVYNGYKTSSKKIVVQ